MENQSPTAKESKIIGPKGYSHAYVAPEILNFFEDNNPLIYSGIYSPWKCQVYFLIILILKLIGIFPNQMEDKGLDKLKLSENQYNIFVSMLDKYLKTLRDPLMRNIVLILKI